jgi:hypothetical protein
VLSLRSIPRGCERWEYSRRSFAELWAESAFDRTGFPPSRLALRLLARNNFRLARDSGEFSGAKDMGHTHFSERGHLWSSNIQMVNGLSYRVPEGTGGIFEGESLLKIR